MPACHRRMLLVLLLLLLPVLIRVLILVLLLLVLVLVLVLVPALVLLLLLLLLLPPPPPPPPSTMYWPFAQHKYISEVLARTRAGLFPAECNKSLQKRGTKVRIATENDEMVVASTEDLLRTESAPIEATEPIERQIKPTGAVVAPLDQPEDHTAQESETESNVAATKLLALASRGGGGGGSKDAGTRVPAHRLDDYRL